MSELIRQDDLVLPFFIPQAAVRGRLVRLGPAVDAILSRHKYPPAVAGLLAEAMALAAALAGALKYEGVFTLQAKGDGPVRMLVADITSDGNLRGYAQYDNDKLKVADTKMSLAPVPRLLGKGYLAFTVDQGQDTDRYQGIVALEGDTLTECIDHYFEQSEQIETSLHTASVLSPTGWRAGALMVQKMPTLGGTAEAPAPGAEDEENWSRVKILADTITDKELTQADLPPDMLLFRLFHEESDARLSAPQALRDRCRCSRDRVATMLRSLPAEDVEELKENGAVSANCEFCSTTYVFTPEQLAILRRGDA
ncbi:Hsp33 family molecular chaperone HslO [Lacibacterium aquatile]|uniref:Hsp33 family molecular chaperone HslO n=1 Tax=Lacibacterium aquatile TaxID=1168082 RepID=A0ABW5DSP9_9PROT